MARYLFQLICKAALALSLMGCGDSDDGPDPLVMYCAAGIKAPVSKGAEQFELESGVPVQIQYGGSGTLLTSIETVGGDIYLAADSSYTDLAHEMGLVQDIVPIVTMKAGLGVAKGNPLEISELTDLLDDDLRIGVGNPEAASIGKLTKDVLVERGLWDELNPTAQFPTVIELANAQKMGALDAVVIWDAVAHRYPEIDFIDVPEFDARMVEVTAGVMSASSRPDEALRFCRFLSESETAREIFRKDGFEPMKDR